MIRLTLAESKRLLRASSYLGTFPFPCGCDGRWRQARNVDLHCPPVLTQGMSRTFASSCVKGGDLALLRGLGLLGRCMSVHKCTVLSVEME